MDTRTKADKLAAEMSRFEQEIMGTNEGPPKGPSGPAQISTPNLSTQPQMPSKFYPRPPGPPSLLHPPSAGGGPPQLSATPRPLLPPRPNGPPQFQMPPGPPIGPPPTNIANRPHAPPRLVPPPPPAMSQQFPMGMPPPPRPPADQHAMPSARQPPLQPPPAAAEMAPPIVPPSLPAPTAPPAVPFQPALSKPTRPTLMFPTPMNNVTTTSSKSSKASSSKSTGSSGGGAEGGGATAEGGLLPVPNKSQRWRPDVSQLRRGGGQVWHDHSLEDWDKNDFRIFVGDLGNDVNDDLLARTFSKYPSFLKARVIRDKWTKKTKGYGFVSFKDPHDFIQAMREMNGKYIGNRPMKLHKSMWKDRGFLEVKRKEKAKRKLGFKV